MVKILVVDDALFMRTMLRGILEKEGHTVLGEAANGVEAVNQYRALQPELVLMDITMPELSGIEAVKAIKILDEGAKVIMCSAMGQQSMVLEAIQAGAKDFIVKPFNHERVLKAIANVMG